MIIRDTVALGASAGVLGTVPQLIFDFIAVQLGWSGYYAFQISGSIYLLKRFTDSFGGLILGGLVWESMAILLGILIVVTIRITGVDYWWLKGLAVSNIIMFIIIYGFLYTLGAAKIVPFDIQTNLTMFVGNVIFGLTASYLIMRLGDMKLDKNII